MPNKELQDMRANYEASFLLEEHCDKDPVVQFGRWFREAVEAAVHEPNAMAISTVSAVGQPSVRMVLLKSYDQFGFTFYTNYDSKKGLHIAENQHVALLFWWGTLERQIRIEGVAQKITKEATASYFHTRPRGSQIAATISEQSAVIKSREALEELYASREKEYTGKEIPLTENWGGYVVKPVLFEFWQGRTSRLHDRIQYSLAADGLWKIERLAP